MAPTAETHANDHTVRSFDAELDRLSNTVVRAGGLVEAQLAAALQALVKRDAALAAEVSAKDNEVDALDQEIQDHAVRLLALRQPVAEDLRHIVGALRIAGDLERIGDYAANVARRSLVVNQSPPVKAITALARMARLAQEIVKDVLDAYVERDVDRAIVVWRRDEELDALHTSLFQELVSYMMEDSRNITACSHLMFIAKNLERIGDHATNIAETVHYLALGRPLRAARPKGAEVPTEPSSGPESPT
ncbi:phosphate signaling complex protein PhoU [Roseospira marina]|uniref:Phosphate-specific transport system accessory protein PhoU n=1 Tax=Roseospira marina TaxID=140057 RepID=A0A5M6IDY6_9PROT|nr:phosphate signaling complex protein PhoU [Roseospira marina]KAA5606500.1 phosphate signaling complex protein PhoU [Roseospira marina]MBB4314078.1 phosphate transport system protein [Roseospira marina]MBB5087239.1 phosphate transport system protein [Roseospira marina]